MSQFDIAVNTLKQIFLDKYIVTVGLSGKDSAVVSDAAMEALKQAKTIDASVGPLYLVTTNTTLDNFVLHAFILKLHDAAKAYAKEHDLPVETVELMPDLNSKPMVELIGRGKLIRTPETTSNGRDCAVDWKVKPMKRFLAQLQQEHQTTKIVSASGSRDAESSARKANIAKRGETDHQIVQTDLGLAIAPIKSWETTDVWRHITSIEKGLREDSYLDRHARLLRKHYAAANNGVCDILLGNTQRAQASCGARFGCVTCHMSGMKKDESLQQQISADPQTYGWMQPFVELREFLWNTLYDYDRSRARIGREVKNGGNIKIGYNHYSLAYRKEVLRYVLTMQRDINIEAQGSVDLIDCEDIIAIQWWWAREGGENEIGEALRIWHNIMELEEESHYIPKTTYAPKQEQLEYRYFNLEELQALVPTKGLNNPELFTKHPDTQRVFYTKDGSKVPTVRFEAAPRFEVVTKDWHAGGFISWFNDEADMRAMAGKCPAQMIQLLLTSGVVKMRKGEIAKIDRETQRAQLFNAITRHFGQRVDQFLTTLSTSMPVDTQPKYTADIQMSLI